MLRTAISAALACSLVLAGCSTHEEAALPDSPVEEASDEPYEMPATVEAVEAWRAEKDWEAKPRSMPLWYQADGPWASKPYAHGNVASSGCGLVSAAMAVSWLAKDEVDPDELLSQVGSSCTVEGLNDMAAFGKHVSAEYGIETSERYHDPWRAVSDARTGAAVICSVSGRLGDTWYGGHIVVAYWDDGLRVADPASPGNSNRVWDEGEFAGSPWAYFYTWTKESL